MAGCLQVQFPDELGKSLRTNATLSMSHVHLRQQHVTSVGLTLQGAYEFSHLYSLTGMDADGVSLMRGCDGLRPLKLVRLSVGCRRGTIRGARK